MAEVDAPVLPHTTAPEDVHSPCPLGAHASPEDSQLSCYLELLRDAIPSAICLGRE